MTNEDEVSRANKADEIIKSEVFKEAFAEIEEAILSGIRRAPIKDVELRDKLCQQYIALHTIRDQIQTYIESGKLASASLAERIRGALR